MQQIVMVALGDQPDRRTSLGCPTDSKSLRSLTLRLSLCLFVYLSAQQILTNIVCIMVLVICDVLSLLASYIILGSVCLFSYENQNNVQHII